MLANVQLSWLRTTSRVVSPLRHGVLPDGGTFADQSVMSAALQGAPVNETPVNELPVNETPINEIR